MVKIKLAALMLNSFLCIVLLAFLILRYIYLTKMSKPYYFLFPDSYQKLVKYFFLINNLKDILMEWHSINFIYLFAFINFKKNMLVDLVSKINLNSEMMSIFELNFFLFIFNPKFYNRFNIIMF